MNSARLVYNAPLGSCQGRPHVASFSFLKVCKYKEKILYCDIVIRFNIQDVRLWTQIVRYASILLTTNDSRNVPEGHIYQTV